MADELGPFDRLYNLLQQVSNDETALALDMVRRYSAGVSLKTYPTHLVRIVTQVPDEVVDWFTTLLSVRAQQTQPIAAWNRSEGPLFSEVSSWWPD